MSRPPSSHAWSLSASPTTSQTACVATAVRRARRFFVVRQAAGIFAKLLKCLRSMLLISCLAACCIAVVHSGATQDSATMLPATRTQATAVQATPRECKSLDIRNDCSDFVKLEGCTVIKGFLLIVLLPRRNAKTPCNFTALRYPMLREITGYLLFYEVKKMKSIRELFPNLTVIRGRELVLNYALGISHMVDLEAVRP